MMKSLVCLLFVMLLIKPVPLFTQVSGKCVPVPPEKACQYVKVNPVLMKNGQPVPYKSLPPISLNAWNSLHAEADWNFIVSSDGASGPQRIPGGWKWIGRYAGKENTAFVLKYQYGIWSGLFASDSVAYQLKGARVAQFKPPPEGMRPFQIVP